MLDAVDLTDNSSSAEIAVKAVWELSGEPFGELRLYGTSTVESLHKAVAEHVQDFGFWIISWQGERLQGKRTLSEIGMGDDVTVQVLRGVHPAFGKWRVLSGKVEGFAIDQWNDDEIEIIEDKLTRLPNKIDVYRCKAHPDGHFEMQCSSSLVPGALGTPVLMTQYLPTGQSGKPFEVMECRLNFNDKGDEMVDVRREEEGGAPLVEPEDDDARMAEQMASRMTSRTWRRIDA